MSGGDGLGSWREAGGNPADKRRAKCQSWRMSDAQNSLSSRQAEIAAAVEARLDALLPGADAAVPARLVDAMRYAALGGGKRFRAFLVMESARLFDVPEQAAIDVAAALECVHAYSLVHDDLPAMDNDLLRRGRATTWKAFDEWTAILAGDALLTVAFEIIARQTALSAEARLALTHRLAIDAGRAGMVGGQVLDLEADKLGHPPRPSRQHIYRLQAMKTGALIAFAAESGSLMAAAVATEKAHALRGYGSRLGVAFQLSDDLLDAEGDPLLAGKSVGKDAAQGKATIVSLMGVDAARLHLADVVQSAIAALAALGPEAMHLRNAARAMIGRQT